MAQNHSSGIWKSRVLDQCLCKEDTKVPLKTCRATFETLQTLKDYRQQRNRHRETQILSVEMGAGEECGRQRKQE